MIKCCHAFLNIVENAHFKIFFFISFNDDLEKLSDSLHDMIVDELMS